MEAAIEPATADLYRLLGFTFPERDLPRAALVAAVLAHVREDSRDNLAVAISTPRAGTASTALITPLRFKRLIAAREPDDLLTSFRRVVAILGQTANVRDLARQMLSWTDPSGRRADIARTRFAFAYHGAGAYAPEANETTPSNQAEATAQ